MRELLVTAIIAITLFSIIIFGSATIWVEYDSKNKAELREKKLKKELEELATAKKSAEADSIRNAWYVEQQTILNKESQKAESQKTPRPKKKQLAEKKEYVDGPVDPPNGHFKEREFTGGPVDPPNWPPDTQKRKVRLKKKS